MDITSRQLTTALLAALGSEYRMRMVELLATRERCVCEIAAHFPTSISVVSHHLSVLERAGVVVSRRDGRWMRYRLADGSVLELLGAAYALDPAFGEAEVLELGADARPAFPDNLPRIRRRGATVLVNGLFRHGFLLAPALARMVADLVLEGKRPEVMDEDHGEW